MFGNNKAPGPGFWEKSEAALLVAAAPEKGMPTVLSEGGTSLL